MATESIPKAAIEAVMIGLGVSADEDERKCAEPISDGRTHWFWAGHAQALRQVILILKEVLKHGD